eukprot:COSAG01_NODE_4406_length_5056_cov_124.577365_3_plen_95_part_00
MWGGVTSRYYGEVLEAHHAAIAMPTSAIPLVRICTSGHRPSSLLAAACSSGGEKLIGAVDRIAGGAAAGRRRGLAHASIAVTPRALSHGQLELL